MLTHPGQPLLLLKQSHKPHNLLPNPNDEGLLTYKFENPHKVEFYLQVDFYAKVSCCEFY